MKKQQTMEKLQEEQCPAFGEAYDPKEDDCVNCIDAEACKTQMEEKKKSKTKSKKKEETINKTEAKQITTKSKKDKPKLKIVKVIGATELKEYYNQATTCELEYEEINEPVKKKEQTTIKKKGMRKPPFVGRGGAGNTASYIEWLLASGKWTLEEMTTKATYYQRKFGKRTVKQDMDKYIKGCINWLKKNLNAKEIVDENKKIKITL